ncbi:unknown protein [Waddlia chondrophila 2032/99]|uniref:Uncharacterized protein n=1 Tax=Waddlia chondrophila 2032/99 TaxID=765953 RepID=F8LDV5_9BACT|nr:unknown protein [Waddlia chondrophila 2032/99]
MADADLLIKQKNYTISQGKRGCEMHV